MTVHGDVISHVNISRVAVEDGGAYECSVENRAGKDYHSARLNIYGKYPKFMKTGNTGFFITQILLINIDFKLHFKGAVANSNNICFKAIAFLGDTVFQHGIGQNC